MSRHGPYPASHHSRNPWNAGRSESVSSSASSQTYQNVPTNHYAQIDSQYQLLGGARFPQEMVDHLAEPAYLVPNAYPVPAAQQARPHHFPPPTAESRRTRPLSSGGGTPISAGYVSAETAVLPCGGHCVALETFCHHLLQVVFVIGSLTGICLIVAGSAMKGSQRSGIQGPDLGVLTYIGAMVSLVSGLLLAIQCCSRPRPPTRARRHRQNHAPHHQVHPRPEEIPLQAMGSGYLDAHGGPQHPGVHLHPAAASLKRQQAAPRVQDNPDPYRGEGGIPWWRRDEDAAV